MSRIIKNKIILLLVLMIILTGCKITLDDTVIKCNELTGECTVEEGVSPSDNEDFIDISETLDDDLSSDN